ncbi:hypothetical protein N0V93_008189 [Gnomoniopsis smithogilvyi]|uniref:Uncharacterized protein n=1 Tax=Gnomoniopsis smithogilvyi TaxID=1191159 RepID=A0A9W8YL84_9PEZI|nr:hypothetical protein N0V93_008189 [Gnomoniopsis smithogilvyi]
MIRRPVTPTPAHPRCAAASSASVLLHKRKRAINISEEGLAPATKQRAVEEQIRAVGEQLVQFPKEAARELAKLTAQGCASQAEENNDSKVTSAVEDSPAPPAPTWRLTRPHLNLMIGAGIVQVYAKERARNKKPARDAGIDFNSLGSSMVAAATIKANPNPPGAKLVTAAVKIFLKAHHIQGLQPSQRVRVLMKLSKSRWANLLLSIGEGGEELAKVICDNLVNNWKD